MYTYIPAFYFIISQMNETQNIYILTIRIYLGINLVPFFVGSAYHISVDASVNPATKTKNFALPCLQWSPG